MQAKFTWPMLFPMYYDLNIDCNFKDIPELEEMDANGYCMTKYAFENYKNVTVPAVPQTSKPIYTRVEIDYQNRLDQVAMSSLRLFDVVSIRNVDSSNISSVMKLDPDIISLKSEAIKHIKKSLINSLKQKGFYIEICLRDALYGQKERIQWMSSLRKLLKIGASKILVISSGAQVFTELKSINDISKILNVFGLSNDRVKKILSNSADVLRRAALKRYSSNGAIATNENEGRLKEDFVINYKEHI